MTIRAGFVSAAPNDCDSRVPSNVSSTLNMSQRIDLNGFEARFADDSDPWQTFVARDEAVKRDRIVRALGQASHARILELACGNGSNSVRLARRCRALDACDGTVAAAALTRRALAGQPHARVYRCVLPGRLPRPRYEAIVIAELLYYLDRRAMATLARDVVGAMRPGGRLILAHHHTDFHDTAQTSRRIHPRFIAATGRCWTRRRHYRNGRWSVDAFQLDERPHGHAFSPAEQ